jgi:hypothetical protein
MLTALHGLVKGSAFGGHVLIALNSAGTNQLAFWYA